MTRSGVCVNWRQLEGGAGAVELVAVHLDDQTLLSPEEIDLETLEPHVRQR
jgi:hypothetical protein